MKLYILGSVASGKSTLARRISSIVNIPCHHLDELAHIVDPSDPRGNTKRPPEERDRLFQDILAGGQYIMEDTGRGCFAEGMRQADTVILLDIPLATRRKRIVSRWLKQKLGAEKCGYRPTLAMLHAMFRWAKNYDRDAYGTKALVAQFQDKVVTLHNNREIEDYLRTLAHRATPVAFLALEKHPPA